ncbi:FAD-dependent oxidoreductase [Ideonella livida]|uniref:FAD-dependent oxidoreductase n=1 Tax=Ideonella livida TaxID=2707176 RepID=A0A7C9PH56_9BURK|nr:FAD-dependent oxidoreductase [Ideonella livida]NDY91857.1 FAD-dependent oxidoreductase [Ideonella livida]
MSAALPETAGPHAAPARHLDVLVCGGGVAGTVAAVAAARGGARVALLERYGFLGGNATAGAVAQFNSWQTAAGRTVVAGLAQEVVDRLRILGGAGAHQRFQMSTGHWMDRVEYAPELLKLVLDEMVLEAGVTPLLHTNLLAVHTAPLPGAPAARAVTGVETLGRGGRSHWCPRVLIDASGDMEAARLAGAPLLDLGQGETLQPATMMFRFGPVDFATLDAVPAAALQALARQGHAQGWLARAALHAAREPGSDDAWFNISRLAVDATDPAALGQAEMEGRRQAWRAARFLREQVPGCSQGQLRAFGTQVGVRETRRVQGDWVLSAEDLLRPTAFADAVAAGAYPIDIHPAQGGELDYRGLGEHHAYQIPWRSLCAQGPVNLLVAGRGLSATHQALAAVRVMTIAMALGQAAGTGAALAVATTPGTVPAPVRAVAVSALQARLRAEGACLA